MELLLYRGVSIRASLFQGGSIFCRFCGHQYHPDEQCRLEKFFFRLIFVTKQLFDYFVVCRVICCWSFADPAAVCGKRLGIWRDSFCVCGLCWKSRFAALVAVSLVAGRRFAIAPFVSGACNMAIKRESGQDLFLFKSRIIHFYFFRPADCTTFIYIS